MGERQENGSTHTLSLSYLENSPYLRRLLAALPILGHLGPLELFPLLLISITVTLITGGASRGIAVKPAREWGLDPGKEDGIPRPQNRTKDNQKTPDQKEQQRKTKKRNSITNGVSYPASYLC
jgi:hypothetical protein